MWRIWFFFGILEISFGAPIKTSQGEGAPSSELVVLKCLLSSPLYSCDDVKRTVEKIPKRIQKLYEKLKKPLTDVASNEIWDGDSLDTIPVGLLYLIPKIRLYPMSGVTASNLVKKFPFDDALTMKILDLITDDTKIQDFLKGLSRYDDSFIESDYDVYEEESPVVDVPFISPAVEEEIGVALSKWFPNGSHWEFWLFKASMTSGTPILANLPNYYLNDLSLPVTEKFLYHLRNWRWDHSNPPDFYDEDFSSPASMWTRHSMAVRRIWARVVLTKGEEPPRWSSRILNQLGFLLTGATPDELASLPTSLRSSRSFHILLHLDWNPLQARSVFDVLYADTNNMDQRDLMGLKNMVTNLMPSQLRKFSCHDANFDFLLRSDDKVPLPTKKQLLEMQLGHLVTKKGMAGVEPEHWKAEITSLGKFVHLVPGSKLRKLENETFDLETLSVVESNHLTYRQIRYLTKSGSGIDLGSSSAGESVLALKSFLKSLPSRDIAEIPSNRLLQNVKEHLLMFTSGDSLASTASVLEKVRSDIADVAVLEKMLYNKDYTQYFNVLGSRDLARRFKDISSNLFILVNKDPNLERNVRLLPHKTLFSMLSLHREDSLRRDGGWSYESLVESPLKVYISGLSCSDVRHLEISDFMPVIGYYVRHRRALGQVFPKNMQSCSQAALLEYLKLKAELRETSRESFGPLRLLEPYEVKAVGGYVLASLPPRVVVSLPLKQHIIREIGKLTIPELLTATHISNVKTFANSYLFETSSLRLKSISALGNLVWFLDADNIRKLDRGDFRLFVESLEENSNRALCLNSWERSLWRSFLFEVFGKPDSWSAGTLRQLGDLLLVLDGRDLNRINRTSRIRSADVLAPSTAFSGLMEWPGKTKPVPFHEVCAEVLDEAERPSYAAAVRNVLRFYLESAQLLLDSVVPADLLPRTSFLQEEDKATGKLHFVHSLLDSQESNRENTETGGDAKEVAEVERNKTEKGEERPSEWRVASEEFGGRSLSDMVQGDQEVDEEEDDDEDDEEDDDEEDEEKDPNYYDYASDYLSDNFGGEHVDYVAIDHNNNEKDEADRALTKTEEKEKLKKVWNNFKNLFSFFDAKKSAETRAKRSIEGTAEQTLSGRKNNPNRVAFVSEVVEEEARIVDDTEMENVHYVPREDTKITCDAIRMLGRSASLVLTKEDAERMSDTELEDCSEVLGSLDLDTDTKEMIWRRLKEWKVSGNLLEVGSLVSVMREDELSDVKLDLSRPWGYENLNSLSKHVTDPLLLSQTSDEFLLDNPNVTTLTYEAAAAMGRVVCTMTLAHQRKMLLARPQVFVNVAPILGAAIDCDNKIFESCIYQLARIATTEEAFGRPREWDANDVATLGVIAAGLTKEDVLDGLKAEALSGLSPSAMSCMPPDTLEALTEKQLSHVPAMTAAAMSQTQLSALSPSQLAVLDKVRRQMTEEELERTLSSASVRVTVTSTVYITLAVVVSRFLL